MTNWNRQTTVNVVCVKVWQEHYPLWRAECSGTNCDWNTSDDRIAIVLRKARDHVKKCTSLHRGYIPNHGYPATQWLIGFK